MPRRTTWPFLLALSSSLLTLAGIPNAKGQGGGPTERSVDIGTCYPIAGTAVGRTDPKTGEWLGTVTVYGDHLARSSVFPGVATRAGEPIVLLRGPRGCHLHSVSYLDSSGKRIRVSGDGSTFTDPQEVWMPRPFAPYYPAERTDCPLPLLEAFEALLWNPNPDKRQARATETAADRLAASLEAAVSFEAWYASSRRRDLSSRNQVGTPPPLESLVIAEYAARDQRWDLAIRLAENAAKQGYPVHLLAPELPGLSQVPERKLAIATAEWRRLDKIHRRFLANPADPFFEIQVDHTSLELRVRKMKLYLANVEHYTESGQKDKADRSLERAKSLLEEWDRLVDHPRCKPDPVLRAEMEKARPVLKSLLPPKAQN